jgi:hypothetical protein
VEVGSLPAPRAPKLLLGLPLGLLAALIGVLLAVTVTFGASPSCGGGEAVGALSSKVPKRLAGGVRGRPALLFEMPHEEPTCFWLAL